MSCIHGPTTSSTGKYSDNPNPSLNPDYVLDYCVSPNARVWPWRCARQNDRKSRHLLWVTLTVKLKRKFL